MNPAKVPYLNYFQGKKWHHPNPSLGIQECNCYLLPPQPIPTPLNPRDLGWSRLKAGGPIDILPHHSSQYLKPREAHVSSESNGHVGVISEVNEWCAETSLPLSPQLHFCSRASSNPISCLAVISKQAQFGSIYKTKIKKCHREVWLDQHFWTKGSFFPSDVPRAYLRVWRQSTESGGYITRSASPLSNAADPAGTWLFCFPLCWPKH